GSGTVSLLGPGATNSTGLLVGLGTADTSTVGVKTGTVTVDFTSNGSGTSELGTTPLTGQSQTVNVSGTVYRLASASTIGTPVNLGLVHTGATAAISLSNTAANDGFSESLDAAATGTTGGAISSGAIS